MALDRQSIEKKDFPVGRRGYDPAAVDAHLSALADEIANLQRSARRRSDTLASSASEQVRAIVDAAEISAADIRRAAEDEAREIRQEAADDALATRGQARVYVDKVAEATNNMLQRLEAMEQEFGTLMESLRMGSNRLTADLQLLEGNLAEVGAAMVPHRSFGDEAEVEETGAVAEGIIEAEPAVAVKSQGEPIGGEAVPESVAATRAETGAAPEPVDAEPVGVAPEPVGVAPEPVGAAPEPVGAAPQEMGGAPADDAEGARLIALNMALNGTPREETDRYLAENFQLSDRGSLLDEVYASVNA